MGNETAGFPSFRHFRNTWLRETRLRNDLIEFWLGHSAKAVTEFCSKLKEDVEFRKKMPTEVGLGSSLPPLE
jgi:integrase